MGTPQRMGRCDSRVGRGIGRRRVRMTVTDKTPQPKWVEEMHTFFQEHGHYRPEDLRRVLGPQDACVQQIATADFQATLNALGGVLSNEGTSKGTAKA